MGKKIYKLCGLALCIFSILFCPLEAATEKLQEKLSSDFTILENPRYVTLMLVDPNEKSQLLKKEIHLNAEETARLKRNILEDHNYDFIRLKRCKFVPDLSFKFENGEGKAVYFFVDRNCRQVLFKTDSACLLINYDIVHERLNFFFKQLVDDALGRNKMHQHSIKSSAQDH